MKRIEESEARARQWREALDVARVKVERLEFVDGTDDVSTLREQVIRTRLAASAERQAHEARALVLDVDDGAVANGLRFTLAVPTGDRAELREAMAMAFAAWRMAEDDVEAMRAALAKHRELVSLAQRVVDAQYSEDDETLTDAEFHERKRQRLGAVIAPLSGWLLDNPEAH